MEYFSALLKSSISNSLIVKPYSVTGEIVNMHFKCLCCDHVVGKQLIQLKGLSAILSLSLPWDNGHQIIRLLEHLT